MLHLDASEIRKDFKHLCNLILGSQMLGTSRQELECIVKLIFSFGLDTNIFGQLKMNNVYHTNGMVKNRITHVGRKRFKDEILLFNDTQKNLQHYRLNHWKRNLKNLVFPSYACKKTLQRHLRSLNTSAKKIEINGREYLYRKLSNEGERHKVPIKKVSAQFRVSEKQIEKSLKDNTPIEKAMRLWEEAVCLSPASTSDKEKAHQIGIKIKRIKPRTFDEEERKSLESLEKFIGDIIQKYYQNVRRYSQQKIKPLRNLKSQTHSKTYMQLIIESLNKLEEKKKLETMDLTIE